MARLLVVVNSVILLLFGSDMFLVGASEYHPLWQHKMRICVFTFAWDYRPIFNTFVLQLAYFMRNT